MKAGRRGVFAGTFAGLALALNLLAPPTSRAQDGGSPGQLEPSDSERLFDRGLAGELTLGAGVQFSTGDFTTDETTDLVYFPLSLAYSFDGLALTPSPYDLVEFRLSIPFIRMEGPPLPEVRPPDCMVPDPPPSCAGDAPDRGADTGSRGGIGDIILSASYVYLPPRASALPTMELKGRVKIPTASTSKGLGTGAAAYSLRLELSKTFFENFTPVVMGGFRLADQAEGLSLNNSAFASVGFDYRLSKRLSGGVFYDYYGATSAGAADAHEISPYLLIRLDRGFRLAPNAVIGLSQGSPDYAIGLQLRYTFAVLR